MRYLIIFLVLLLPKLCFSDTIIKTARGDLAVKDGDIVNRNSMWQGTVQNLNDVTFIGWNFSRQIPHTEVFINCHNLKFINCNLNNVELQADFTVKGSLTIHQRTYEQDGKTYKEVECGDNKTRTYDVTVDEIDVIERDFSSLKKADKDKLRQKYQDEGIKDIIYQERNILVTEVETPDEKKIKGIRISSNTGLPR